MRIADGIHRLGTGLVNASLARLDGVEARLVLPGHGQTWTGGVAEAVRLTRASEAR